MKKQYRPIMAKPSYKYFEMDNANTWSFYRIADLTKKDEVGKDDGNSYCSGCLFLHLNS